MSHVPPTIDPDGKKTASESRTDHQSTILARNRRHTEDPRSKIVAHVQDGSSIGAFMPVESRVLEDIALLTQAQHSSMCSSFPFSSASRRAGKGDVTADAPVLRNDVRQSNARMRGGDPRTDMAVRIATFLSCACGLRGRKGARRGQGQRGRRGGPFPDHGGSKEGSAAPSSAHAGRDIRAKHERSRAEARTRTPRWRGLRDNRWAGCRDVSMEGGTADAGLHKVKESWRDAEMIAGSERRKRLGLSARSSGLRANTASSIGGWSEVEDVAVHSRKPRAVIRIAIFLEPPLNTRTPPPTATCTVFGREG
ncbi:hypothetical protein B0H13DRAFT_2275796 [Mycena leptocephala]|nr:hypothetical protein B0H13DRAFT_2275796 [Mycena leptocephala]